MRPRKSLFITSISLTFVFGIMCHQLNGCTRFIDSYRTHIDDTWPRIQPRFFYIYLNCFFLHIFRYFIINKSL